MSSDFIKSKICLDVQSSRRGVVGLALTHSLTCYPQIPPIMMCGIEKIINRCVFSQILIVAYVWVPWRWVARALWWRFLMFLLLLFFLLHHENALLHLFHAVHVNAVVNDAIDPQRLQVLEHYNYSHWSQFLFHVHFFTTVWECFSEVSTSTDESKSRSSHLGILKGTT